MKKSIFYGYEKYFSQLEDVKPLDLNESLKVTIKDVFDREELEKHSIVISNLNQSNIVNNFRHKRYVKAVSNKKK